MATGLMYRITQVGTGVAGSPYYVTGYFDQSVGDGEDAAAAWAAFAQPSATFVRNTLVWLPITTLDVIDSSTGNLTNRVVIPPTTTVTNNGGDPLPPANQVVVNWRTGVFVNGREVRGRTNLPGHTEDTSTGGVVSAAVRDATLLRANTLINAATAGLVVYSKSTGTFEAVSSAAVMLQFGILKSRRD